VAKKTRGFFQTRNFGLVIGGIVFGALLAISTQTLLIESLELKVLDINFRLKQIVRRTRVQEGVTIQEKNPRISPDILIIGIDDRSLDTFGRWPFPRYTHANLVRTFARIQNQAERERALLLDVFFDQPDRAVDDALLVESIQANGRVFLEPILTRVPVPQGTEEEYFGRQEILTERYGSVRRIEGDWTQLETLYGVYPPLKPYARAAKGYGHPNFVEDPDQVYRRQPMLVKLSRQVEEIRLEDLRPDSLTEQERSDFYRLAWIDTNEIYHDVAYPLTDAVIDNLKRTMQRRAPVKAVDTNNDGEPDQYYYVVRKYRDVILPAVTLSLALEYFNKSLNDIEVVLGSYIRIPQPQHFNTEKAVWEPYRLVDRPEERDAEGNVVKPTVSRPVEEIRIPINARGQLLVNFMGFPSSSSPQGLQTFPVRSFAGYASRVAPADPEWGTSCSWWAPSPRAWRKTKRPPRTVSCTGWRSMPTP
jgi:adenylate cyclase